MQVIDIPTEQTTALTDFILGLIVVGVFLSLYRLRSHANMPKVDIWLYAFGFLGLASFIGAPAHGLAMSPGLNFWLWQLIYLALGLVIAMFVTATVFDLWGENAYRRVLWPMVAVAIVFYLITVLISDSFLTFVAYEAVAMLFALAGYVYLAARHKLKGAWWMVAGILLTILAAVVQASGAKGVVIFAGLDNNGVFHLIQWFGVLTLWLGLRTALQKGAEMPQVAPA